MRHAFAVAAKAAPAAMALASHAAHPALAANTAFAKNSALAVMTPLGRSGERAPVSMMFHCLNLCFKHIASLRYE